MAESLKRISLLLSVGLLAACSGGNIINGQSFPPEAAVYRCSEYDGSISGQFTNTTAQIEGCQCMQLGEELKGVVEIVAGDSCKMTFTPSED